jgi:DNA-binding MarR family transcriptional regulator/GNAT superfamily N-acetyltransferase
VEETIAAVRAFNRFYTQLVGALDDQFLGADLTLPEARLLFEIANADQPLASDLQKRLDMDAGYVSRLIGRFETRAWIVRTASDEDARRRRIALTSEGRAAHELVDTRQRAAVEAMVERLSASQRRDLIAALGAARALLDAQLTRDFAIRTVCAGDLPLIASRQAILYRDAYGWGRALEANVTETAFGFLRGDASSRSEGWVAEVGGAMAGSVLLTDEGEGLSRLRLLYVEPWARGRGIGEALVTTCLAFAREAGYRAMTLWTHSVLESARRIYAAHGFQLVETATHHEFGVPVQGETWRLELTREA